MNVRSINFILNSAKLILFVCFPHFHGHISQATRYSTTFRHTAMLTLSYTVSGPLDCKWEIIETSLQFIENVTNLRPATNTFTYYSIIYTNKPPGFLFLVVTHLKLNIYFRYFRRKLKFQGEMIFRVRQVRISWSNTTLALQSMN